MEDRIIIRERDNVTIDLKETRVITRETLVDDVTIVRNDDNKIQAIGITDGENVIDYETVNGLIDDVDAAKSDISTLQNDVSTINTNINTIEGDIDNIEGDVDAINDDIETINNNIQTLSDGLQTAEQDIQEINTELDGISEDVADLETNVADLEQGLQDVDASITQEITDRQNADTNLQNQINTIISKSDVVDVVGTYAELLAYDTSKLGNNDVVKVLVDESRQNVISYYRWVITGTAGAWSYVGSQGPFYTKAETDTLLNGKQNTIDTTHKLDADLVDDTDSVNKFITEEEKQKLDDIDLTNYITNTDYAGTTGGVVKINSSNGINIDNDGVIKTEKSTNNDIDLKTDNYKPITPANLDYAIKAGLVNNANTLSTQDKEAIKSWLGIVLPESADISEDE